MIGGKDNTGGRLRRALVGLLLPLLSSALALSIGQVAPFTTEEWDVIVLALDEVHPLLGLDRTVLSEPSLKGRH